MRWSLESMKLLRCSLLVARFPLPPRQNRRRLHAHTHTHTQGHIHPCVHLGVQQLRGGISKLEGKAAASKTRGKLSAFALRCRFIPSWASAPGAPPSPWSGPDLSLLGRAACPP